MAPSKRKNSRKGASPRAHGRQEPSSTMASRPVNPHLCGSICTLCPGPCLFRVYPIVLRDVNGKTNRKERSHSRHAWQFQAFGRSGGRIVEAPVEPQDPVAHPRPPELHLQDPTGRQSATKPLQSIGTFDPTSSKHGRNLPGPSCSAGAELTNAIIQGESQQGRYHGLTAEIGALRLAHQF